MISMYDHDPIDLFQRFKRPISRNGNSNSSHHQFQAAELSTASRPTATQDLPFPKEAKFNTSLVQTRDRSDFIEVVGMSSSVQSHQEPTLAILVADNPSSSEQPRDGAVDVQSKNLGFSANTTPSADVPDFTSQGKKNRGRRELNFLGTERQGQSGVTRSSWPIWPLSLTL